jgi:uncharacterized protein YkwD
MIQQMLKQHNEMRKKHNRHPLSLHPKLREAAKRHALDMQKHDLFSHTGSDDSDKESRVKKTGYPLAFCVENIASGGGELGAPDKIFHGWMNSAMGHKENLLHPDMRDVGFGCVSGEFQKQPNSRVWVAVYARSKV